MTQKIFNRKYQKDFRKDLRSGLTSAEATLWPALKRKQLYGRKFRRQHGIGKYVVDFYCPSEKLVVELDGADHFSPEGDDYDLERDSFLKNLGLKVVRFENQEIWDDLERVLEEIRSYFKG
jgi:very-short-patch-repair endonuclease